MAVIAHIGAVPLEEIVRSVGGAGAGLLLVRAWISVRLQRCRADQPTVTVEREPP